MPPPEPRSSTVSPSLSCGECGRVAAAERREQRLGGNAGLLSVVVEVRGDRIPRLGRRAAAGARCRSTSAAVSPSATRWAARPYFSRTETLRTRLSFVCSVMSLILSRFLDDFEKKKYQSAAGGARLPDVAIGLSASSIVARFGDGFGVERVVVPAAFAAAGDEAGVAERFEMPRQLRLGHVEFVHQLAHATFAVVEQRRRRRCRISSERAWKSAAAAAESRGGAIGMR